MTRHIASGPQPDDFVTATGGARRDDVPAAPAGAPVTIIDAGELVDVSGGTGSGTLPLPHTAGVLLPSTFLPRPSPTVPLEPFFPPSPTPAAA